MKTATDYWLENTPLQTLAAYVEGDMETVRKADDRFASHNKPIMFDSYQNRFQHQGPVVGYARIGRQTSDGTLFLLPPRLAGEVAAGRVEVPALVEMSEPDVARVDIERLPAGGLLMTYPDPFTKRMRSSGSTLPVAMPWQFTEWFQSRLVTGSLYELSQEEASNLSRRMGGYWQALMLRYFTLDLDYELPTLLDLANVRLDMDAKLDLLRGEFQEYQEMGIPPILLKDLLPTT